MTPLLAHPRSEEHTSELQSPVPISYAVFCLKKKTLRAPGIVLAIALDAAYDLEICERLNLSPAVEAAF